MYDGLISLCIIQNYMKKILILYASYGGGHLSAAKSIQKYIDEHYPEATTEIVDCIKYISNALDKLTTGAYREMAKKLPSLWGKIYMNSQKGALGHLSSRANKFMAIKLKNLVKEKQPDIIISTHPFSSQMISYLKRKGKINPVLATILTDFASHEQWLVGHEYTDYFFVSNDNMEKELCNYGVEKNKIHVTGIPMSDRFFEKFNKDEIYKMFALTPNQKVILFFGGGEFGLGKDRTIQILRSFITNAPDYQIVAISGKNEKMKETFENTVNELQAQNRVRILGFTDKVPELMSISYLVVTKPGGLTSTESLASHLPMIIINPIPGQEEQNAEFLENHGVGIWIRKEDNPDEIITKLFSSEETIEKMRKATKQLAKTHSTQNICEIIMGK